MSVYIVVHNTKYDEIKETSKYLYETLNKLYPDIPRSYHDGSFIVIGGDIQIDLRWGIEPDKLAGIRPNYYYTDSDGYMADMLAQSAYKVNGKRLKNMEQLIQIINFYMSMYTVINQWLETQNKED